MLNRPDPNGRIFPALIFFGLLFSISGAAQTVPLQKGWWLQSACKVNATGEAISGKSLVPKDWISTTVPATVVAAQVAAGQFKNIYFGMKMRELPGMTYPIGLNSFANVPMDKDSPYACGWWYRTRFKLPVQKGRRVALHFDGINYRANIWLNGKKIADKADVAGAYNIHEFDVTDFLADDGSNVLAVETFGPSEKDLGINWVDWNPTPPDKNMGLWGDVYLSTSGAVTVRHPAVITHFPDASLDKAELTVLADVENRSAQPVTGTLEAVLNNATIRREMTLAPGKVESVTLATADFPALTVANPKLWWPVNMGQQNLQNLTVRFRVSKQVSDERSTRYGIREVTSELTDKGHRLFKVNGKNVLIRGGGWAQDMLLRHEPGRLEDQFRYVLGMNLNTIRQEAQLENEEFYRLADELGVMVIDGWCCCDIWEKWDQWEPGTQNVATASLRSQLLRLRSHPSVIAWFNGSDGPPPEKVESAYLQVEKEVAWPNPIVSSASAEPTKVTGRSGVKMSGPYDYEPPSYWLVDTKYGGAYGFNTETSPGPAVPVTESLKKFIPEDKLWPINDTWNYHSGGERFQTMSRYLEAMDRTYGKATDLDDFQRKSQAMSYDGQRAMFEAYARNKYTSTGVIQWMLNNGWPSIIWHLYDYYLQPAGGYFGTKKACEPVHIQYSYNDRSVVVVNGLMEPAKGLKAEIRVLDTNIKEVFSKSDTVDVDVDGVATVDTIPAFPESTGPNVYFVKLTLRNPAGDVVSNNFYWLPEKLSVLDFDKTPDTAFTPIGEFEDLTGLTKLPQVALSATATIDRSAKEPTFRVRLKNPSSSLAFQTQLAIEDGNGNEILPVLWSDNYVSLLPGESRELTVQLKKTASTGRRLRVGGWNVKPATVAVGGSSSRAREKAQ